MRLAALLKPRHRRNLKADIFNASEKSAPIGSRNSRGLLSDHAKLLSRKLVPQFIKRHRAEEERVRLEEAAVLSQRTRDWRAARLNWVTAAEKFRDAASKFEVAGEPGFGAIASAQRAVASAHEALAEDAQAQALVSQSQALALNPHLTDADFAPRPQTETGHRHLRDQHNNGRSFEL